MSEGGGFEAFSAIDSQNGVDQGALEQLRERMAAASAQGAKDQKREAKQKKGEDNLAQIIVALLKSNNQEGLIRVVANTLADNVPAYFILAILALRFQSVRKTINWEFNLEHESKEEDSANETSLVPGNFSNSSLPLKIRLEMDAWLQFLINQSILQPKKILQTIQDENPNTKNQAKTAIKGLISYVIQDYLQFHRQEFNGQNIVIFANNFADSMAEYLNDYLKHQKQLFSENSEAN